MDDRKSAEAVAKRKNTRTKKKYPLFAEHLEQISGFYVTVDQVEEQRKTNDENQIIYWDRMEKSRIKTQERAYHLRDVICGFISIEAMEKIDLEHKRILGPATWSDPAFQCEYLVKELLKINLEAGRKECPHRYYEFGLHRVGSYVLEVCPVCGGDIPQLIDEIENEYEKQLDLF